MAAAMIAAILRGYTCDMVLRCGLYAATLSMQSYQAVPCTISPSCLSDEVIRRNAAVDFKILTS